jgi:hypothetical protein
MIREEFKQMAIPSDNEAGMMQKTKTMAVTGV